MEVTLSQLTEKSEEGDHIFPVWPGVCTCTFIGSGLATQTLNFMVYVLVA